MKKIVFFIAVLLTMMVFVGCEPELKEEYTKKSYVNNFAVVDGIKDPMNNIEWLNAIQEDFIADKSYYLYRAVLQFMPEEDSVKRIFIYQDETPANYSLSGNYYERQAIGWVKNTDGTPYKINGYDVDMESALSKHTRYKIEAIIDTAVGGYFSGDYRNADRKTRVSEEPDPLVITPIDQILNNATDIEVLSCYKLSIYYYY